jgi:hypothetical protein
VFFSCSPDLLCKEGRIRAAFIAIVVTSLLSACGSPVAPSDPDVVRVNGTVRFMTFEGGFWAVRGDDQVTYDPVSGLPAGFQIEGLRVRLVAKHRPDLAGTHMAGPIVEIITIARLGS